MALRLKELRESKRLKQSDLARSFQVKQNTISAWETGQREPDITTIIKISAYFNVTTDFLLGKDKSEPPKFIEPSPPPLSREERGLLDHFRRLPLASKQALMTVASQMAPARTMTQGALF